ncbi:MAG: DNA internalization-related competence protein ComEC/Rec2 [Clostridia bacterium]|nr:DNA internalization-related competence protein ComEC/Rec2 [Clostridia bacterium]
MMRRPMLFAACGCVAAIVISYYSSIVVATAAMVAAACGMHLRGKEERRGKRRAVAVVILISYCLGCASFWHADRTLMEEASRLNGNSICGEIIDCEERVTAAGEPCLQMIIKTDCGKILCKSYDNCRIDGVAAEGCGVEALGKCKAPSVRRNPGCFDYALYLRSLGVTKTMTCDAVTVSPVSSFAEDPPAFLKNKIFLAREGFIQRLTAQTDPLTGALIRAVLFGDKGSLDEDVLESFRKNGTAHILAVSGLHIGIIYGFILRLWRWRKGWTFLLFNTVFFLLYAAAAGFSPSVTRAVIMVLLHIAAGIRNRRYDLANAAFLVLIGVIVHHPYMVFNAGFQMSFLAVLSLTLVLPYMKRIYTGIFLASAAVQVGLGPFILYNFNSLSLLAVIINVPVVALTGLIVPLALVCMVLSPGSLLVPAAAILKPLCAVLIRLNETTQIDGISTFQVPSPPLWLMAVYYLCLLLFATEEGRLGLLRAARKGRYVLRMLVLILVLSMGFAAFASDGFEDCDITFVDVGQGDCICVRTESGCYLFDGGGSADYNVGKSILREYLLKNGISHVDGAFVTHLHTDHYKGICELSQLGMVDHVYVYEANRRKAEQIAEDTGLSKGDIIYLGAGDTVPLGDRHNYHSVYVDILYPDRRSDAEYGRMIANDTDENLLSLVFKVNVTGRRGETSVLITGDLGEEGEKELIRSHVAASKLKTDILKVGHHGSKTSTSEEFLAAVCPDMAVIQVGKNNLYGHPTPETLERLSAHRIDVFRNDLQGAVGVEIRNGNMQNVRTMIHDE